MKISERIPLTEHTLRLQAGKKVYFVSDVHLGAPVLDNDRERENRLIRWLDTIRPDCSELFLLGDIFDFCSNTSGQYPKDMSAFWPKYASLRTRAYLYISLRVITISGHSVISRKNAE